MATKYQQRLSREYKQASPLKQRISKTTGTTVGEARGVLKTVRKDIRAGKTNQAKRVLAKSLTGGPAAGVTRKAAPKKAATAKAKKVVSRIERRQRG